MIAWPSRRRGFDPREAKCAKIKRMDESIDRTNRIVSWSQFVGQVGSEVKVYSCC